jgi:hypothetical protein
VISLVLLTGFDCATTGGEVVCGNGFNRATGSGEFGADENAMKLEAFLDAVAGFDQEASILIGEAEDVCFSMGEDIGISTADLRAAAAEGGALPTGSAAAVCALVADQMEIDMATIRGAEMDFLIDVQMPECTAELRAVADCYARCEADFNATVTPVTCEGGGIYVDCNVGCTGQCRVPEVVAECHGYCEGSCTGGCTGRCSGQCDGSCTGWCEGSCDVIDPETGQCAGTCTGTCNGECDASCEGYCTGTCEGRCSAGCVVDVTDGGCTGECWGECTADVDPVRCQGGDIDVQASAQCEAACQAEVSFEYECDPPVPQVFVEVIGDDAEVIALATTYAHALQNNLPDLVMLTVQLGYVVEATAQLVATSVDGLDAAIDMSAKAIACAYLAVDIVVEVDIQFSATVDATYDVATLAEVETGE